MAENGVQSNVEPMRKRRVAPSSVANYVLALLAMGLPMIGVTVNLWLGAITMLAVFLLSVWGLWKWENHYLGRKVRKVMLTAVGIVYLGFLAWQIHAQYHKDHRAASPSQPCQNTGSAIANGSGSIANSGCDNSEFSTGTANKKSN